MSGDDLRALLVRAIRDAVRITPLGPNSREIHERGGSVCLNLTEAEQAADAALSVLAERLADAWEEGRRARPQFLGAFDGHDEDCAGWEDCHCGTYVNPYRPEPTGTDPYASARAMLAGADPAEVSRLTAAEQWPDDMSDEELVAKTRAVLRIVSRALKPPALVETADSPDRSP